MATQLTPEQQAYYQGLSDYEAALVAQAQSEQPSGEHEQMLQAQMLEQQTYEQQMYEQQMYEQQVLEAQMLEQQMLEAQLAGASDVDEHIAQLIDAYETALLHHQMALEEAAHSVDAAFMHGLATYEQALAAQMEEAQSQEQAHSAIMGQQQEAPHDEHSAYAQGLADYELDLHAQNAADRAKQLSPELRKAYDQGRADYEKEMQRQRRESGSGTSEGSAESTGSDSDQQQAQGSTENRAEGTS
jgi:hypothetical protein